MKKKQEEVQLSKKTKKTIDYFINFVSEINKQQNEVLKKYPPSKYYSFKNTLKDSLYWLNSEQYKNHFKQKIAKSGK